MFQSIKQQIARLFLPKVDANAKHPLDIQKYQVEEKKESPTTSAQVASLLEKPAEKTMLETVTPSPTPATPSEPTTKPQAQPSKSTRSQKKPSSSKTTTSKKSGNKKQRQPKAVK